MLSPMTVRLPAVAVAGAVALPMAAAMVVVEAEPPLQCAPTRAMAMAVLALQHRLPSVRAATAVVQWWRKWLPNRLVKSCSATVCRNRRCLQAAPVVVVQRPADRTKTPLILSISPIGSTESVGLLVSGWS